MGSNFLNKCDLTCENFNFLSKRGTVKGKLFNSLGLQIMYNPHLT